MIAIEIDAKQLKQLRKAVAKAGKQFPRELAAAVNKVANSTKTQIGKDVRSRVAMSVVESKKPLKIKRKATGQQPSAIVSIERTRRLGLHHFKARQDARGVSYKIQKNGGRQRLDGAFQGPRPGTIRPAWGGMVLQRIGEDRLPLVHIKGVSAYGVYAKNNLAKQQEKLIRTQLRTEMQRRIDFNILRANGLNR